MASRAASRTSLLLYTLFRLHGFLGCERYLKAINELRKHVIHHRFWELPWPGDFDRHEYAFPYAMDALAKYEKHFHFAETHLPHIPLRAGYIKVLSESPEGRLIGYPNNSLD